MSPIRVPARCRIDVASKTVIATITVGASPSAVALNPGGNTAYVTNAGAGTVSVIDIATNTVTATIKVGTNPSDIAITPDGTLAFVTNTGSNTFTRIDTATNKAVWTVGGLSAPSAIAISPDGKYAYITNKTADTLASSRCPGTASKPSPAWARHPPTSSSAPTAPARTSRTSTAPSRSSTPPPGPSPAASPPPAPGQQRRADPRWHRAAGGRHQRHPERHRHRHRRHPQPCKPTPHPAPPPWSWPAADGTHVYLTDNTANALRVVAFSVAAPQRDTPQVGTIRRRYTRPDDRRGQSSPSWPPTPDGDPLTYTVSRPPAGRGDPGPGPRHLHLHPDRRGPPARRHHPRPRRRPFTVTVSDGQAQRRRPGRRAGCHTVDGLQLTNTATVGTGIARPASRSPASRAYVTDQGAGTVSVIDASHPTTVIADDHRRRLTERGRRQPRRHSRLRHQRERRHRAR